MPERVADERGQGFTIPSPLDAGPAGTRRTRIGAAPGGLSESDNPMVRPLHERLRSFRSSAFDLRTRTTTGPDVAPTFDSSTVVEPATSATEEPAATAQGNPTLRPERWFPNGPRNRPVIVQRTSPTTEPNYVPPEDTAPDSAPPAVGRQRGLLFSRRSPLLNVETVGPRQISVGKESVYEVTMQNRGEVEAEEVVVYVALPAWAHVVGAQVSSGATHAAPPDQAAEPFQWRIGNLPARGRERLLLKIVPRESRPFDLAVRWDYRQVTSQALIEVQEAKLEIELAGPREVHYGEKQIYTLKLSNTGSGDAENVLIKLVPIGSSGNQPVAHNVGTVQAGQRKAIEVELTARQVGNLTIKVEVRADGGLYAELAESVLVRRAALQVDIEGPRVQYVGAVAKYLILVRNPGTAAAKNVGFSVVLPPGAKYVSGIQGGRLKANGTKLGWDLQTLDPAAERTFVLNCRLDLPGSTQIDVVSAADGDLTASAGMTTQVEAMADLVMAVDDPAGPIPIGEEAAYEVRIRNRGTKNAPNVEVLTYFSRGIEPTTADGAQHKLAPGQVIFSPIPSLAPGEDIVLKVYARAETVGNHIFRAEVHCRSLGTRLVSEDTTHFYKGDPVSRQASRLSPAESPQDENQQAPAATPTTATKPTPAAPQR